MGDLEKNVFSRRRFVSGSSSIALGFLVFSHFFLSSCKDDKSVDNSGGPRLWENGVIPYYFDSSSSISSDVKDTFREGMSEWSKNTNLKFVEGTPNADSLKIYKNLNVGNGMTSTIGHCKDNFIVFGKSAKKSTVEHELGHIIGLYHEHQRSDRDDNVIVNWENIKNGREDNFKISEYALTEFDYDVNSIMHYPSYAFSKDGSSPTILRADGSEIFSDDVSEITQTDIANVNFLYSHSI